MATANQAVEPGPGAAAQALSVVRGFAMDCSQSCSQAILAVVRVLVREKRTRILGG